MLLSLGRLSLLGAALIVASYSQLELASANDWQSIAPADAGFAPNVGELLDQAVRRGQLPNLHAVVGIQRSVREWPMRQGWGGRAVRQEQAQGILVAALGVLVSCHDRGERRRLTGSPGDAARTSPTTT
jgi:hypothetical protein